MRFVDVHKDRNAPERDETFEQERRTKVGGSKYDEVKVYTASGRSGPWLEPLPSFIVRLRATSVFTGVR